MTKRRENKLIKLKEEQWDISLSQTDKWFTKLRGKIWKEIKKERKMNIVDLTVIIYLVWRLSNGNSI